MTWDKIINRAAYSEYLDEAFLLEEAEGIIAKILGRASERSVPVIVHMLGVPGAGKSTYVERFKKAGQVVIAFDEIMEQMSGYVRLSEVQGARVAFERWEAAARALGYEILHRAVLRNLDIIFDHSGARADHVAFLKALKAERGYGVHIVHVRVDVNVALERAGARDRFVPLHYVLERGAVLEGLLEEYAGLADVFEEYEGGERA